MIWFTSDTHFGHENVLKFTDRPWETIQQMNSVIVANINARVGMNDALPLRAKDIIVIPRRREMTYHMHG